MCFDGGGGQTKRLLRGRRLLLSATSSDDREGLCAYSEKGTICFSERLDWVSVEGRILFYSEMKSKT